MYHSLTFEILRQGSTEDDYISKNTWDDWHLIPSSRPTFAVPPLKTKVIEIPGADGVLDVSETLTGYPVYGNREGSFEFFVMNDYSPTTAPEDSNGYASWQDLYSEIMNTIHGRLVRIIPEDDPSHYYYGRVSVNEWASDPDHSKLVLDYSLDPYKYALTSASEDWLWDPFDFETGVIREYGNINISEQNNVYLIGSRMQQPLVVTVTEANNLAVQVKVVTGWNGDNPLYGTNLGNFSLSNGTNQIDDVLLEEKEYELHFHKNEPSGSAAAGIVSIEYVEGSL